MYIRRYDALVFAHLLWLAYGVGFAVGAIVGPLCGHNLLDGVRASGKSEPQDSGSLFRGAIEISGGRVGVFDVQAAHPIVRSVVARSAVPS